MYLALSAPYPFSYLDNVNQGFSSLFVHLSSEVLEVVSNTHFITFFMVLLVGVLAVVMVVLLSAMLVAMLFSRHGGGPSSLRARDAS